MKSIAVLALLCAPALADPHASYALNVQVKGKAIMRTHALAVTNDDCAEITEREADHTDEIHACAIGDGKDRVILRVDWSTVQGNTVYKSKQSMVVTRGAQYTIGSPSTTHLIVDVK